MNSLNFNKQKMGKVIFPFFCYNNSFLSSAGVFGERYERGISNTVFAPEKPSLLSLYAALAYDVRTLDVNSGFDWSLSENSRTCHVSFFSPVFPLLRTNPPCGIPLWSLLSSSSEIKCTVVS